MKILHTVASLSSHAGGPARSVPMLALAQAKQGHDVIVWTSDSDHLSFPDGIDEDKSVKIFSCELRKLITSSSCFDIVHDHGLWEPFHHTVAKLCRSFDVPNIVSARGMLEPWALNHKKIKKRIAWHLYQRRNLFTASGLHATSESEMQQFKRFFPKAMIHTIPNGVSGPEKVLLRSGDYSDSSDGDRIYTALFLGRVHPQKGLEMVIHAWAKLRPKSWCMRVVGPDEDGHVKTLKKLVTRLQLDESWSFHDPLEADAKWNALLAADITMLPSHSENFGIAVAESLACGTPVITTTGTPWEGLIDNDCGWWVRPSIDELCWAMNESMIKASPEILSAMGGRGRAWVARDFSWPSIATQMLDCYRDVIGNACFD